VCSLIRNRNMLNCSIIVGIKLNKLQHSVAGPFVSLSDWPTRYQRGSLNFWHLGA